MNFSRARTTERGARRAIAILAGLGLALAGAAAAGADLEEARGLASQGRPEEALQVVERELSTSPESPGALFLQGVLLVELRRADEARNVFSRLIDLHPEMPEPYNNLAVIQAADGDYEGAVETLRRSLETHASYRTAYENLTKIYTQLASEAYSQALDSEPVERPEVVELVLLGNLEAGDDVAAETSAAMGEEMAEAGQPEPETLPAEVDSPAASAPAPQPAGPAADSVAPFVDTWRTAWQEQRVEDYLASYSADFKPDNGASRTRWAASRRARLAAPQFIRVTLAYLDEPVVEGTTASIRFLQSYESDSFQDRVTKTLVLGWEGDGWKILEERSD